jgi:MoxR-like ATPase
MNTSEDTQPSLIVKDTVEKICVKIKESVFGHDESARLLAGAFVIGGHVLLEGPPGIAKTLLAKTFAATLGLRFKRIQFTPDLMPADVTGVYVFDQATASFRLSLGPIFADIVLADEINRTPPKTQSALLEAMQEKSVTIDGKHHFLGDLFFVVATQNPVEHEGTYPLPEAQLDRFLFKLEMTYPGSDYEVPMIQELSAIPPELEFNASTHDDRPPPGIVSLEQLLEARRALREVRLDRSIADYIHRLVKATREHSEVLLGASPRAALNLAYASKLSAAMDCRDYVIPDDVKQFAVKVLAHRLVFQPEIYLDESNSQKILHDLLNKVSVPERM